MVLQSDKIDQDKSLRLELPTALFEVCRQLKVGQQLQLDGTNYKHGAHSSGMKLYIVKSEDVTYFDLEVPILDGVLHGVRCVISAPAEQNTQTQEWWHNVHSQQSPTVHDHSQSVSDEEESHDLSDQVSPNDAMHPAGLIMMSNNLSAQSKPNAMQDTTIKSASSYAQKMLRSWSKSVVKSQKLSDSECMRVRTRFGGNKHVVTGVKTKPSPKETASLVTSKRSHLKDQTTIMVSTRAKTEAVDKKRRKRPSAVSSSPTSGRETKASLCSSTKIGTQASKKTQSAAMRGTTSSQASEENILQQTQGNCVLVNSQDMGQDGRPMTSENEVVSVSLCEDSRASDSQTVGFDMDNVRVLKPVSRKSYNQPHQSESVQNMSDNKTDEVQISIAADVVDVSKKAAGEVHLSQAVGEVHLSKATVEVNVSNAAGEVTVSKAAGEVTLSKAAGEVHLSKAAGEVLVSKRAVCGVHVCDLCSKSFRSRHGLNMHRAVTHAKFSYNNPYRCQYCHTTFPSPRERKLHQYYKCSRNLNVSNETYICSRCDKPFQTCIQMMTHMHRNHQVNNKLTCLVCEAVFNNPSALRAHTTSKHMKNKFVCEECGKSFPYISGLRVHSKTHDNSQSNLCPKCGKRFMSKRALSVHLGTAHQKAWPFKCQKCDRGFKLQRKLDSHLCSADINIKTERLLKSKKSKKTEHTFDKSVSCPFCDTIVSSCNLLCKHMTSLHEDHPQYKEERDKIKQMMRVQCDTCGLDFSTTFNLSKHQKLKKCNKGELPRIKTGHPCPFCAKISSCLTHLARHMKFIHQSHPQYETEQNKLRLVLTEQCEICDNWYPDKNSYNAHYMNSHDANIHRCPHCRKPFKHENVMQKHLHDKHLKAQAKSEKSSRRYFRVCKECPKSFLNKQELKQHVELVHEHQRVLYQCDKCSYQYFNARQYFTHNRQEHSNKGYPCGHCGRPFMSRWFLKKHKLACTEAKKAQKRSVKGSNVVKQTVTDQVLTLEVIDNFMKLESQQEQEIQDNNIQDVEETSHSVILTGTFDAEVATIHNSQPLDTVVSTHYENIPDTITEVVGNQCDVELMDGISVTSGEPGNEQVIYLPANTEFDLSQLAPGTIVETSSSPDGTTYYYLP